MHIQRRNMNKMYNFANHVSYIADRNYFRVFFHSFLVNIAIIITISGLKNYNSQSIVSLHQISCRKLRIILAFGFNPSLWNQFQDNTSILSTPGYCLIPSYSDIDFFLVISDFDYFLPTPVQISSFLLRYRLVLSFSDICRLVPSYSEIDQFLPSPIQISSFLL